MNGKLVTAGIALSAALTGAAVWYLQVYAYYERLTPASAAAAIRLTGLSGTQEPMSIGNFEGIDAQSSPLRFRGCFTTPLSLARLSETVTPYEKPTPLIAPSWFTCFDAGRIGADLEAGTALAFLAEKDIHPGVDRVVAVYADGRAFAWHQLNESADQ